MSATSHEKRGMQSLPASGPKLDQAIDQALVHLVKMAKLHDYEHQGWDQNPRLWREILNQSKSGANNGVAQNLLKGDLASATGSRLGIRQWRSFEKWFARHVAPELASLSAKSGIPALHVIRIADQRGGHPDQSEAVYFLSYPEALEVASNEKSADETIQQTDVCNASAAAKCRWRFGLSMVLLSIFLLLFCTFLPTDSRRLMFIGFSAVLLIVGIWDMDSGNKGRPRRWSSA